MNIGIWVQPTSRAKCIACEKPIVKGVVCMSMYFAQTTRYAHTDCIEKAAKSIAVYQPTEEEIQDPYLIDLDKNDNFKVIKSE